MSTTSGRAPPSELDRLAAVARLADDVDVRPSSRISRKPLRTSAWSSAISDADHADPSTAARRGRGSRRRRPRPALERAAEERDALAHPDEPVPAAGGRRAGAGAVVGTSRLSDLRLAVERTLPRRTGRVLRDVRQRLLDDPVGGEVDAGWSGRSLPRTSSVDVEPGCGAVEQRGRAPRVPVGASAGARRPRCAARRAAAASR